jgi:hypothetical protein
MDRLLTSDMEGMQQMSQEILAFNCVILEKSATIELSITECGIGDWKANAKFEWAPSKKTKEAR